jgi:hypothetical protein
MRYQKMVKIKDTQFCMENLRMKIKKGKIFLTFWSRDSNPGFSKITTHDLVLLKVMESNPGEDVKSSRLY